MLQQLLIPKNKRKICILRFKNCFAILIKTALCYSNFLYQKTSVKTAFCACFLVVWKMPLMENTENAEYFSKNLAIIYYNRLHCIVFRLKPDMAIFLIKGLNRCRIIYHGNNYFSILGSGTGIDKYLVTAENTGIYHGITLYV